MPICLSFLISINHLTIFAWTAIAGGSCFFFAGFYPLVRKLLSSASTATEIRNATPGKIKVNGEATGPNTIQAPITGKPCFLYQTIAWQLNEGNRWEKIADETLHLPFFIADSTGQLLVEPLGADLDLPSDFREEYDERSLSSDIDNFPPRVSDFLTRHRVVRDCGLLIEERLIRPEDPIFVAGTLMENPGVQVRPLSSNNELRGATNQEGANRSQPNRTANHLPDAAPAPQVVKLSGGALPSSSSAMSQQAKIAAALNRAGITRPEAWSAAGLSRPTPVIDNNVMPRAFADDQDQDENQPGSSGPNLAPPVVLMKGTSDSKFVISCRSQGESLGDFVWKSVAMILGGVAILFLGVYTLLAQTF
ncbi:MAG: GIDE domain-containing protein [Terriglobales bacterium]